MVEVVEDIAGGGIDRHGTRIRGGICLFLPHMELQGLEMVLVRILVGHIDSYLCPG